MAVPPQKVTVRAYRPEDYAAVVHAWQRGFSELTPYSYRRIFGTPIPFVILGVLGVLSTLATSSLTARLCIWSFILALCIPKTGIALLSGLMEVGIFANTRKDMTREKLPAVWQREGESGFFVAEADGVIVGCAAVRRGHTLEPAPSSASSGASYQPREASIWKVSVVPAARKLGVGRLVMAACEQWAAAQQCTHLSLICGNDASQLFYRRLGFSNETRERAYRAMFGEGMTPRGLVQTLKAKGLPRRLEGDKATILVKAVVQQAT